MDLTKIIPNFEMTTIFVKGEKRSVKDNKAYFATDETKEKAKDNRTDLGERQKLVLDYLGKEFPKGATAKELSVDMYKNNLVPSPERNSVHPRLNELIALKMVRVIGKKICQFTDRSVSIYKVI